VADRSIIPELEEGHKKPEEDSGTRRQPHKVLNQSDQQYQTILSSIEDGYYEVDIQGNLTFFNNSLCKIYGYERDELMGMNNREYMSPDTAQKAFGIFNSVYKTGKSTKIFDWEFIKREGTKIDVEISVSPIINAHGQTTGFRGIVRDISERKRIESALQKAHNELEQRVVERTADLIEINKQLKREIDERKEAEGALRESEEKYRLLTENLSDVIWTMNMDLNYTYISPAIEKIQGWSVEEASSLTIHDIITPKSIKKTLARIEAHMIQGAKTGNYNISDRFELEMYCKDGTTIWTEISASSILDEEGNPVGFLGVTRDISERNKLEIQLQRAQKMEAIGTLAGGVAHDLNNVLSAQVSYPDLILTDLPEESTLRKPILAIQKSGKKAAEIVQDLLTLARRGVVATEAVNLNHITEDYIQSPECENLEAFHAGIHMETDLSPNLLNIMGSSVHLSKTVMNLVSNAAEAMPHGGNILISTQCKYIHQPIEGYDDVKEGDYVILTVSDTGIGIPSRDIERIFEPFYTKKVMGRSGTGLGMAVVWGTVKDHKGYIDVQSREGKGTSFTLYFPVTGKKINEKKEDLPIEAYMGKGESILVVDDVEDQREIASGILNKLRYTVTSVSSGEEAIDYLKNSSVDLLILDMIMDPGIDGLETYKKILKLHPEQRAIIASGFSETDRVKEAQLLGAGQYLKKPYTMEKMGLAVNQEFEK
jgi:two-component system, cell cycle sensor histidine kinase and response regulator CckA